MGFVSNSISDLVHGEECSLLSTANKCNRARVYQSPLVTFLKSRKPKAYQKSNLSGPKKGLKGLTV